MRADARTNKRQLLDSAAYLLAEQGPQVSLRTIAKHAGVGVATLYRHFPTREALEEAVVLDTMAQVADAAHAFCGGEATAARWREFADRLAGLRIGALVDSFADDSRDLAAVPRLMEERGRVIARVEQVVAHAAAVGLIDDGVPPTRFIAGLAVVTRPIPVRAAQVVPDQESWLLGVYLDGLVPAARRDR